MSRLLETVARRIAGQETVSRRELFAGERRLETAPPPRSTGLPPAPADLATMRAALAKAPPTREELLALVDALAKPLPDGSFNASAKTEIRRLRARLQTAHAEVAAIARSSAVRTNLLAFLAEVDEMLALLAQVGQSTNASRATRLRAQANEVQKRADAAYRLIAPALARNSRATP